MHACVSTREKKVSRRSHWGEEGEKRANEKGPRKHHVMEIIAHNFSIIDNDKSQGNYHSSLTSITTQLHIQLFVPHGLKANRIRQIYYKYLFVSLMGADFVSYLPCDHQLSLVIFIYLYVAHSSTSRVTLALALFMRDCMNSPISHCSVVRLNRREHTDKWGNDNNEENEFRSARLSRV